MRNQLFKGHHVTLGLGLCMSFLALTSCHDSSTNTIPKLANNSLDIRADVNRDGFVNMLDNEAAEQISKGAIVLPNLDDDSQRCIALMELKDNFPLETDAFLNCNDASDDVSNGKADIDDLTLVKLIKWEAAPKAGSVKVSVTDRTGHNSLRVLIRRGEQYVDIKKSPVTIADLHSGADLAVEAKDIIRDTALWDGSATLKVEFISGTVTASDELPLQVAPVITQHDLGRVVQLFVSPGPFEAPEESNENEGTKTATLSEQDQAILDSLASHVVAKKFFENMLNVSKDVIDDITILEDAYGDIWAQDLFEPAFVSRPTENGNQVIRILLRSPTISRAEQDFSTLPIFQGKTEEEIRDYLLALTDKEYAELASQLTPDPSKTYREAGIALYTEARGADVGVVQIKSEYLSPEDDTGTLEDTFNSTGNFTTTPPHNTWKDQYPYGRMVYGSTPNPRFIELLESQGVQNPIQIPTQWLMVGHVDEFISFLPSSNERGWVLAVADPELAYSVLQQAQSSNSSDGVVYKGQYSLTYEESSEDKNAPPFISMETSLDDLLADKDIRAANDFAITYIDQAIDILKKELDLSDADIIRLPVLYKTGEPDAAKQPGLDDIEAVRAKAVVAYFPDAVNGVYLGENKFVTPKQFGPLVNGEDALQKSIEQALKPHGISVKWVDDLQYAHLNDGEVHCVTNAYRDLSDVAAWWR